LTTACVQALCASTHILIPTVLDPTSAKAVGYFGTQLKRHETLWPHLRVVGLLGTMTRQLNGERDALQIAGDQLREKPLAPVVDGLMVSGGRIKSSSSAKSPLRASMNLVWTSATSIWQA
jgi:hypothetical protein